MKNILPSCFIFILKIIFCTFVYGQSSKSHNIHSNDLNMCLDNKNSTSIYNVISPVLETNKQSSFVSDHHIANAPCRNKKSPSIKEMKKWLKNWANSHSEDNEKVYGDNGFMLDKPKMIKLFKKLAGKSLSSNNPIKSKCLTVICASQKIFGEKEGIQLLYMLAKYGFNGSPYPFSSVEGTKLWKSSDLDKVFIAFLDFPEESLPNTIDNTPFLRATASQKKVSNHCIAADSAIRIYDCLKEHSDEQFIKTTFHEIAHVIGIEKFIKFSIKWLNVSGWIVSEHQEGHTIYQSFKVGNSKCMVSSYGATSPFEDFAESVVTYRYNPHGLKKICPEKYFYLKDHVFNDVEYLNKNDCPK